MKVVKYWHYLHFFALVYLLMAAIPAFADENPWERKLPFKNATINYEITGMENGTEILYVKEYGRYRALHHDGTTKFLGMSTRARRLEITDPDWLYTFDLEEKSGSKITNPNKFYQEEYAKLSASEKKNVQKNSEELGMSMVNNFNGQTVQNAVEILGYSCDRTTIMGMTVNVIHQTDVPLSSEVNIMGMKAKIQATSINTGKPSGDAFLLPSDIVPVHDILADNMAREMAVSTINTLKDPDGAEKMRAKFKDDSQGEATSFPQQNNQEIGSDMPPEKEVEQDAIDENVQQGLNLIKGLFGN